MLKKIAVLSALAGAVLSIPALAQTGELWEMTSQMSMAGMPAGMIPAQTSQVCQSEKFDRTPGEERDRSKCTISNMRQSPNRIQYDIRCEGNPPTTGSADYSFEANRTRVKGTMRMVTKDGEMTMQMTGRKVGTCDAAEHRKAQMKPFEDAKRQSDAAMKQAEEQAIKACHQDLEKMQPGFGIAGMCAAGDQQYCQPNILSPAAKTACNADISEFCKRYQTRDGLLKIGSRKDTLERAGKLCKQPVANVRARLCPAALKDDALRFVALHCPADAKLIAAKECGGRSFTVAKGSKYGEFCAAYRGTLADAGDDDDAPSPASSRATAAKPAAPTPPSAPAQPNPGDAASQAIQEGLGKLKGLFGR
ncbi:MAG TPA: DUF3617 family protein [Burkholderiales bacterium]|nr:DUF3617 family protein [Burkholderiales bacterium]